MKKLLSIFCSVLILLSIPVYANAETISEVENRPKYVYTYDIYIEKYQDYLEYEDKTQNRINNIYAEGTVYFEGNVYFENRVAKLNSEKSKLQRQLSALSADNSISATAKKNVLNSQLNEIDVELDELWRARSRGSMISGLENELDTYYKFTFGECSSNRIRHNMGVWITEKRSTCEEAGEDRYCCTMCDYYAYKIVDPLDHKYTSVLMTQPTCENDGVKIFTCANDSEHTYTEVVPAIGHSFGDYISNGDGTQTRECSVCHVEEIITDSIAPAGNEVVRIKGKTRYETSIAIANATKEEQCVSKFSTIIIASGTNFADALAGSYLAKVKSAPILMSSGKNDAQLKEYISANLASGGTVYILGGTAAVPQSTENTLTGYNVKRLKGKTRFDTNIEILKEAGVNKEEIIVATAYNFADSLSASAVGKPILLVDNNKGMLNDAQKAYLSSLNTDKFYIVGGTGAVKESIADQIKSYGSVERVKGSTRYETSVAVAKKFFANPDDAVLAYAENFPDGLCGGSLAMAMDAPLILTKTGKQAAAKDYIQENNIINGAVLGGTSLIDDATTMDIFNAQQVTVW